MIIKADLHLHTDASPDGRADLNALTAAAKARGLDAVAVTDHNICTPVPERLNGVLLIPGCEVSTRSGHITALFLERPLTLTCGLPKGAEAVAEIRRCGGLAILAHPFQSRNRTPDEFTFDADGAEIYNARADLKRKDGNALAAQFAAEQKLIPIGGSDAHSAREVGNAYTELDCTACTIEALREALEQGRTRPVLVQNTTHTQKGLSQWRAARRRGVLALPKAAAYWGYCLLLDIFKK